MTARKLAFLLLSSLALAALMSAAWARDTLPLDGEWKMVARATETPPAASDPGWKTVTLPSLIAGAPGRPQTVWYRKSVQVPFSWTGSHLVLRLQGAKFAPLVLVNGKEAGRGTGGLEPSEYDLSAFLTPGERNEVQIRVQTAPQAPGSGAGAPPGERAGYLTPVGAAPEEVGIWDRVWIEKRPRVYVSEVRVLSSVRDTSLGVRVTVKSLASKEAAAKATNRSQFDDTISVTARVRELGSLDFDPVRVTLAPGEEKTVTLWGRGTPPALWWPAAPRMYTLKVGVQNKWQAEAVETRFGFRDLAVEGDRLLLNGQPLQLLIATFPRVRYDLEPETTLKALKEAGANAVWLQGQPWPEAWYTAADETGMLVVADSALVGPAPQYSLSPSLWAGVRAHVEKVVRALAHHPSIVAWNVETEMIASGNKLVPLMPMQGLRDLVRGLDGTRPVLCAGEDDLGGAADLIGLPARADAIRGRAWPEAAFWYDRGVELEGSPEATWQWTRNKPLAISRWAEPAPDQVRVPSLLFGDGAYPRVDEARAGTEAFLRYWQILAARQAGVSLLAVGAAEEMLEGATPVAEALAAACRPVAVFDLGSGQEAFSGGVAERRIAVLNGRLYPRTLSLHWRLAPAAGDWHVSGEQSVEVGAGGSEGVTIALALPVLSAPTTEAIYTLEVWEGPRLLDQTRATWRVFGREAWTGRLAGAPARVALYDPAGEMGPVLADAGIEATLLTETNLQEALPRVPLALVGEGAFDPARAAEAPVLEALLRYVQEGGSLLVMAQHALPLDLPVSLRAQETSVAFVRDPAHPLLQGLDDRDFAHWLPNGILSDTLLSKTTWGGFRTLVDCGGEDGLNSAALAEVRLGKGRIILCQLPVMSRYGVDPSATRLVRNLLAHGPAAISPAQPLGLIGNEEIAGWLAAIGADTKAVLGTSGRWSLSSGQTVLVTDFDALRGREAGLQTFVRRGGTVLLHNVTPSNVELVTRLLGGPLAVRPNERGDFTWADLSGPARGMSNENLAWFVSEGEEMRLSPTVASFLVDPSALPSAKAHVDPPVLLSIPYGRGLWVVDQVRWDAPGTNEVAADYYLATLLQNLGVSFSLPTEKTPPAPVAPAPAPPAAEPEAVVPAPVVPAAAPPKPTAAPANTPPPAPDAPARPPVPPLPPPPEGGGKAS